MSTVASETEQNVWLRDPDVQRMLRVQDGDDAAFGELVEAYQNRLIGIFRHLLRDPEAAEDLAQEAFLRVYRARERYRPTAKCAAASEAATCDAPPAEDAALGTRLCACAGASRRRALSEVEATATSATGAAAAAVAEATPSSDAAESSAAHPAAARGCPNSRLASRPGAQPCPSGARALADSAARAEGVEGVRLAGPLAGPLGGAALVAGVAALVGAMLTQRARRRRGAPPVSVSLLAFVAWLGLGLGLANPNPNPN